MYLVGTHQVQHNVTVPSSRPTQWTCFGQANSTANKLAGRMRRDTQLYRRWIGYKQNIDANKTDTLYYIHINERSTFAGQSIVQIVKHRNGKVCVHKIHPVICVLLDLVFACAVVHRITHHINSNCTYFNVICFALEYTNTCYRWVCVYVCAKSSKECVAIIFLQHILAEVL